MLFFVACSMVFYLKALKSNDLVNWGLFGILSALAFWTHFYALVFIGSLVLYAVFALFAKIHKDLTAAKPAVAAAVIFSVICLPLIVVTIQLFAKRTEGGPTFGFQGLPLIYETFMEISCLNLQLPGSGIAMAVLLLLFLAGIVAAFLIDWKKAVFLVTLTVLPFLISYFLSFRIPMQPRYLVCLAIVLFLAAALCCRLICSYIASPWIVYGFLILMIVINAPILVTYYSGYSKPDWRGFAGGLERLTHPGDFAVVLPGYNTQPLDYYYSNSSDLTMEFPAYNAIDLKRIVAQKTNNTIYYIKTDDLNAANPEGDAAQWLEQNTKSLGQNTGIYLLTSG